MFFGTATPGRCRIAPARKLPAGSREKSGESGP